MRKYPYPFPAPTPWYEATTPTCPIPASFIITIQWTQNSWCKWDNLINVGARGKRCYKVGCYMLQSRTCLATGFYATSYNFFCSMLHATLSNMFVINWCSMLQTTFDLSLNSVRMCMDVRNTLERLRVQLNMADTNMSVGKSSCDEKHEKRKRKGT